MTNAAAREAIQVRIWNEEALTCALERIAGELKTIRHGLPVGDGWTVVTKMIRLNREMISSSERRAKAGRSQLEETGEAGPRQE